MVHQKHTQSISWQKRLRQTLLFIVALGVALGVIFPYYWMIVSALKAGSLYEWPPSLIPSSLSLAAFKRAVLDYPILRWFRNSSLVALATTLLSVLVSINAGYALSRFKNRINTVFGLVILFTQMLPATLLVVPFYVIFRQLGLFNNLGGLAVAVTVFVLPLAIWLMKGFFDSIPADLEAQAQVDGCSRIGAFYRITLPLALPGIVVVSVFSFIAAWDEYFFARTLISSENKWVLSVGLSSFQGQYSLDWPALMAAAVLFVLPPAIFFLFVQRYLVRGLMGGAVKG